METVLILAAMGVCFCAGWICESMRWRARAEGAVRTPIFNYGQLFYVLPEAEYHRLKAQARSFQLLHGKDPVLISRAPA